jgi:hypothetical protein
MTEPDGVYRAPMWSRLDEVDRRLAVERALRLGLVGMGDRSGDERTAARLERFKAVPDGAEVWTRDEDGLFRRGVITGPWRYDDGPDAYDADLRHVRPCDWDDEALEEHRVPAAVAATFRRGGRNFQRVRAL